MKKLIIAASLSMSLIVACAGDHAGAKPPVYALNSTALEANKKRIQASDPLLMPAYKALLKDADKMLEFAPVSVMEKKNTPPSGDKHDYMSLAPYFWPDPSKPNGLPYMRKDGQTNPEVKDYKDKEYMPQLCETVQTLALAYYFSGDRRYADHATTLLRVWFLDTATRMNPNLNFAQAIKGVNDGRGAGLIDARHFIKVVDAVGLLQGAKSWTAADDAGTRKWFADFRNWMETSKVGKDEMNAKNNHGAWYDALRLALALGNGDKDAAQAIIKHEQDRLDYQMDDNGFLPKEMERTMSLHYSVFAMEAFELAARMGEQVGVDFWNYTTPSGKSLKKGFDVLQPYLAQQKAWEGQQIKQFDFEEGYLLLMNGAEKMGCKTCSDDVKRLAGDKASRLRINLFY